MNRQATAMGMPTKGMVLLAGNSHPEFARLVSRYLSVPLGSVSVLQKSNRETSVEINETMRSRDVFIIQTGTKNVNNDIMELIIMMYACKTADARTINVVMPYLPYCKQSKMRKRGAIVSRLLAALFCHTGLSRMITVDLHKKEIQGFYSVPIDNLRASSFLIQYVMNDVSDYRNAVIVARNAAAMQRAASYSERLRLPLAVIHGEEHSESEQADGRNSPPPPMQQADQLEAAGASGGVGGASGVGAVEERRLTRGLKQPARLGHRYLLKFFPMPVAKEKAHMQLVGDVSGRIAIIVEDMVDDIEQFVRAAELLHDRGAYRVIVMATHGLLSADAATKIAAHDCRIDEVVVTNTVPHEVQKMQCHKIKTVDVSVLVAEGIRRIHNNESISDSPTHSVMSLAAARGKLMAIIGDEDTITGFLLGGIGESDKRKGNNFFVVDNNTKVHDIEEAFKRLVARDDVSIILVVQHIAEMIRPVIDQHTAPLPSVLEIPSKEHPYDASKDSVFRRAKGVFSGENFR
uniref:Pribosyltran_N domain-containing protein n=2 Tax=Macrostomum lignano TaxID=282301 RepID=A0A1I8H5W2_9PLAT